MNVELETAKLLKQVGYPQDTFPQMVYGTLPNIQELQLDYWHNAGLDNAISRYYISYLIASDCLDALDWLENEKGYLWYKSTYELGKQEWSAKLYGRGYGYLCLEADTSDDLIQAICKHILEKEKEDAKI